MITVVNATFFGDEKSNLVKLPDQPQFKDVEYKFFTNKPEMVEGNNWKVIYINPQSDFRKKAREIKTDIHKFIPNTNYWLWIDNNCQLQVDPHTFLQYLQDCDIVVMPHPERGDIIEEANALLRWKPEQSQGIQEGINHYYEEGYVPKDLYETKVLMRRNTEKIRKFNSLWWKEIQTHSIRDQISFPYISWKTKTFINTFPGNNSRSKVRHQWKNYIPYWEDVKRI
jgi:hypothetical protein